MSIGRNLFNEFRPLFRLLEEPFTHPAFVPYSRRLGLGDSFLNSQMFRPSVDVSEEGKTYVVEAELPGVKKENIDVRIGANGQSVTIEGHINSRLRNSTGDTSPEVDTAKATGGEEQTSIVPAETSNQISTERPFAGTRFTRTVWLPRPVDATKVSAKLEDGILTLRVPRAEDQQSVKIDIQ
ncbi:HSP20-like chaperone [Sistotremastrum suecicum HHB10207 ss-3]|uniref:HSP20-like chaperone n=1 Tax=Sistotremastrum suecicum HHB10207 ss-3 TaxID=1314776 RepID=A0A165ZJQ7_9AGAM|nr:HSP20-like chaperone [Sistotremastrum suecicum HHB10207 ss-3]